MKASRSIPKRGSKWRDGSGARYPAAPGTHLHPLDMVGRGSALDCGSPPPLFARSQANRRSAEDCRSPRRCRVFDMAAAFAATSAGMRAVCALLREGGLMRGAAAGGDAVRRCLHIVEGIAVVDGCAASRTDGGILQVGRDLWEGWGRRRRLFVFQSPLLNRAVNLAQVVDAGILLRSRAGSDVIRDGDGSQHPDCSHDDHDFYQGEGCPGRILDVAPVWEAGDPKAEIRNPKPEFLRAVAKGMLGSGRVYGGAGFITAKLCSHMFWRPRLSQILLS